MIFVYTITIYTELNILIFFGMAPVQSCKCVDFGACLTVWLFACCVWLYTYETSNFRRFPLSRTLMWWVYQTTAYSKDRSCCRAQPTSSGWLESTPVDVDHSVKCQRSKHACQDSQELPLLSKSAKWVEQYVSPPFFVFYTGEIVYMWHFQVEIRSLWDCEYKAKTNVITFLLETHIQHESVAYIFEQFLHKWIDICSRA